MRIPVGDKYMVIQDERGAVRVERHGEAWIDSPPTSKMLVSIGYELLALRSVVAQAIELLPYVDSTESPMLRRRLELLDKTAREMDGLVDWRRHLSRPGEP